VLNRCRSALRRQVVAQRFGRLRDVDYGLAQLSAEADAIRAEERHQVLTALASLPARRREVLVLRYYLGLSEAEIARTLGISQGSVKSAAARGIAALARKLEGDS
jgi:RNA polymerase sigma factor (sigma-70 family)